jgi:solute carrier family 25 carnitine/acylcarnitine transporter 20/29
MVQVQIMKSKKNPGVKPQFAGVFDCARQVLSQYGVRGCYLGLSATILRNVPANGVYFGTYEALRAWFARTHPGGDGRPPLHGVLLAGGVGGLLYWLTTFPTDVVKSSMQSDSVDRTQRRFRGVADCARQLWAEGGVRRLYRGLTPALARSVPANAMLFLAVEEVRFRLHSWLG